MSAIDASQKALVAPQTLKGFRDLMPGDMIARNSVVEKMRRVFEKYGFVPIDTPVLEHLPTLVGAEGEAADKELFRLTSPEGDPIAMRFDLTVPFARLLAQYPEELRLPFRRYHIGPVFRADKPESNRYRQFTQFDIDAAGSASVAVDAEIVAAMSEVIQQLGLAIGEYRIRVNNRKLVDALLTGCGVRDEKMQKDAKRAADKLLKVGMDNVRKELGEGRIDDSGDPIRGVGLPPDAIAKLIEFISVRADTREAMADSLRSVLPAIPESEAALRETAEFNAALASLCVNQTEAVLDPSLMRGLDIYTGPVFEASLGSAPEISFMGGGRYDKLVSRFSSASVPATGASIGLDRLMNTLVQTGKLKLVPTTTRVLVLALPRIQHSELLAVAGSLRQEGIPTEVFFLEPQAAFRDQLSLANARQVPVAVILGEDELKAGTISVKDLRAGMQARVGIKDHGEYKKSGKSGQVTVPRADLVKTVKQLLQLP